MAGAQFLLLFGFIFVLIGGIAWFIYTQEKKRVAELTALAHALGLRFEKRGGTEILSAVGVLDAMPRGNSRRVKHVLSGNYRGLEVRVFQYTYQTGSGKNQQTHNHAVGWARLPVEWPGLTIVPEHVGHKLFDALGGDDIDFESDEFSRKYWVRCKDRRFAYDVVHGRMMDHLMAPGWQRWELKGPLLVSWEPRSLKASEVQRALERIVGFVDLMPSFRRPPGIAIGKPAAPVPTFAAVVPR